MKLYKTSKESGKVTGIYFSAENDRIFKESGILDIFSKSHLVNLALEDFFPLFLNHLKDTNSNLYKLIDLNKRKREREVIRAFKYEFKSRISLIKNFNMELRQAKSLGCSQKEVVELINYYIKLAFTYENPENLINKIREYIEFIKEEKNDSLNWTFEKLEYRGLVIENEPKTINKNKN